MSATAALAGMTGLIPVVVAGGMVLKFTEAAMPRPQRARRKASRRKVRKTPVLPFGNFSNLSNINF